MQLVIGCRDHGPTMNRGSADEHSTTDTQGGDFETTEDTTQGGSSSMDVSGLPRIDGLLTFTRYEPEGDPERAFVGLAGAWRNDEFPTDDLYAVVALEQTFPSPPELLDSFENNHIPMPFEWGDAKQWVELGNAVKLTASGAPAGLACLSRVGTLHKFPVYLASQAPGFDSACAPRLDAWVESGSYELVLYGGDVFDNVVQPDAVPGVARIEVLVPALGSDVTIDRELELELAWSSDDDDQDRVVFRAWDQYGSMVTANVHDDGNFVFPLGALAELSPGPGWFSLARERSEDVGFPHGMLRAVVRHEVRAKLEIF